MPEALQLDLHKVGVTDDLVTMVNSKDQYPEAIPILADWLQHLDERTSRISDESRESLREAIVRCLAVPRARGIANRALLAEFRKDPKPDNWLMRWTVGAALAAAATEDDFDELVELARDKRYGRAREELLTAIGRMKTPAATDVLIELLEDPDVLAHAVIALRLRRDRRALPALERFLNHPRRLVRNEAKRAVKTLSS